MCIAVILTFTIVLNVNAGNTGGYPDVRKGEWYYPRVKNVSEQGLMSGYINGYFGPNNKLTRGEFAVILWRMDGKKEAGYQEYFSDIKGKFYEKAAKWAGSSGVIKGYENGCFGGDENITREQMVTILSRYAAETGKVVTRGNIYDFPDGNQVSSYAKDGVAVAVGSGWITGDKGYINPQGEVVRAVCATLISKYVSDYTPSVFELMPESFSFSSG